MDKKKIIKQLREIDRLKQWRKEGYTSAFDCCVRKFGYDEPQARELLIAAGLILIPENMKSSDPKVQRRIDALRNWRKKEAAAFDLSAYVVIPNRTLLEIAIQNPRTKQRLAEIPGMGDERVNSYGVKILKCLRAA